MEEWKERLQKQAAMMLERRNNMTPEQKQASIQKARETRMKNKEAKMAQQFSSYPALSSATRQAVNDIKSTQTKLGRPKKHTNLDELAQQMGFGSATEALIEMAVRRAGFASVQEAAMWAVKEKARGKTDIVTATVGKWESFDD